MGLVGACTDVAEEPLASVRGLEDVASLEASVETALRAASAGSPAVQRSAHAAASQRADSLLRAVQNILIEEETFDYEDQTHGLAEMDGTPKVFRSSFLEMVSETLPRVRDLARRAAASTLEDWEASAREEVMERLSNSAASQYSTAVRAADWPDLPAGLMPDPKAVFQLSRGGLVSYTLSSSLCRGSLQGEGIWVLQEDENDKRLQVRIDLRQGMHGKIISSQGVPQQVHLGPKTITVVMQECKRVTVPGAVPSDEEEGDEEEDEEET